MLRRLENCRPGRAFAKQFHAAGQTPLSPDSILIPAKMFARLDRRLEYDPATGCFNYTPSANRWMPGPHSRPYSHLYFQDETGVRHRISIHRLALIRAVGPLPSGIMACHSCDNPRCGRVDGEHVYNGTAGDNARDTHRAASIAAAAERNAAYFAYWEEQREQRCQEIERERREAPRSGRYRPNRRPAPEVRP